MKLHARDSAGIPGRPVRNVAGTSLVQVLGALVIVVLLIGFLAPQMLKGPSGPAARVTQERAAVSEARDAVCRANLDHIRRAIALSRTTAGLPPRSLADLSFSGDVTRCAVGGEPYLYSPATGEVRCPHAGHESY